MSKMTSKTSKSNSSSVSDIKDNETYQSMEHKEHILNVPDTYIGSVEPSSIEDVWVCNSDDVFVQKDVEISPGFYNIFNEILTNSSDQCLRTREYAKKDKTVQITTVIKITIDEETGIISILNDGDGIPVFEHPEKKIMIPELIFGQLLTSSNYDKTKKKTWGGKNGYGSKVCNIYSTMFEVETVDHRRGKKFKQVWRNNMSEPEKKAKVTDCKGKAYTKITFLPEYSRFGMPDGLKGDVIDLIRKRAYDIAGCSPRDVGVYFNGVKLEVKDFPQYVEKYIGKQKDVKRVYEKPNEFWEVVACASPDGNHRQVSLVNGICTINGGKHVDYITNKICKDLVAKVNGKAKTGGIKPNHVKNNLWVFINSLIVNPSFSSQTKEALTTPVANFGSKCELSDDFIKKLAKTEIADRAKLMKSFHDKSGLSKTDGKKTKSIRGIPKLDDANWAGTAKSHECTLILTEGDSAKALVISGLSVVGRDKYGVFPLRGKLLNVREASDKQITGNAEIQNIKKILGLQQGTKSIKDLRYGKVLILTDQDEYVCLLLGTSFRRRFFNYNVYTYC
jgi:DNA topoisomerase II